MIFCKQTLSNTMSVPYTERARKSVGEKLLGIQNLDPESGFGSLRYGGTGIMVHLVTTDYLRAVIPLFA
jgi:hypothetical protein